MTERTPIEYLDYLARCAQAFRPFTPVDLPDFFKGRREHVAGLTRELGLPGRQVAIYGERGVGKTSLAILAYFFANFSDEDSFIVRCERESRYDTIFGSFLEQAGSGFVPNGLETESQRKGGLRAGFASFSRSGTTRRRHASIEAGRRIGPALLLRTFKERRGLLILDEYDRVRDEETHTRLAETLKHFSDAASQTKIIVVGVARTLTELMGQHESLTRCLAQIELNRMSEAELAEIITEGESRLGALFKDDVRRRIVRLADGFPFFVHLLGYHGAEVAGEVLRDHPDARPVVAEKEYAKALRKAIQATESSLRDAYTEAVLTTRRKTDMCRDILWAVACSENFDVQVREIADNLALLTGEEPPTTNSLNNYLGPLIKPERRSVLTRVRPGYYKFTDPFMRPYIRLLLEELNVLEKGGQLQFPWMKP